MPTASGYGRQSQGSDRSIDQQHDSYIARCAAEGWEPGPWLSDRVSASRYATKVRDDWPLLMALRRAGDRVAVGKLPWLPAAERVGAVPGGVPGAPCQGLHRDPRTAVRPTEWPGREAAERGRRGQRVRVVQDVHADHPATPWPLRRRASRTGGLRTDTSGCTRARVPSGGWPGRSRTRTRPRWYGRSTPGCGLANALRRIAN